MQRAPPIRSAAIATEGNTITFAYAIRKNLIAYAVEIKGTGVVMKDGKAIPNATSNFSKPSSSNFLEQFIIPMALEQISN